MMNHDLLIRGKPQTITYTLGRATPEREARAKAFLAQLNGDELLQAIATAIINSAYQQDEGTPQPHEYAEFMESITLKHLDLFDDDFVLFFATEPQTYWTCQAFYDSPIQIEEVSWHDE